MIKEPEKPAEEATAEGTEGDAAATTSEGAEGAPSKEAETEKKMTKEKQRQIKINQQLEIKKLQLNNKKPFIQKIIKYAFY